MLCHHFRMYDLTLLRTRSHPVVILLSQLVTERASSLCGLHKLISDGPIKPYSGKGNRERASVFPWAVVDQNFML